MIFRLWRTAFAAFLLLSIGFGAAAQAPSVGKPQQLTAQTICQALGYCPGQGTWYAVGRVPLNTEGQVGDLWFRTDTNDILKKGASTWSVVANIKGTAGYTVRNGTGAPGSGVGVNGDFYIDTASFYIYGPKAGGAWSSGTPLMGNRLRNGTGTPSPALGVDGDFYIDTSVYLLYGPKASGSWGAGVGMAMLTGNNVFTGVQTWKGFAETYTAPSISAGTLTIDLSAGTFFNVASNANLTTLTISNAQAGKATSFTMVLTGNGTGYTQSWGSVLWPGGIAPILTTTNAKRDWLAFVTNDGGTTWFGFILGQNF